MKCVSQTAAAAIARFANPAAHQSQFAPITIPMHEPIKKVYVMMVKEVVESEVSNREDD